MQIHPALQAPISSTPPWMALSMQSCADDPRNLKLLRYLARDRPQAPAFAPFDAIADAYYKAGCHPEIVDRLWDQIGAALPVDCRCLIYGTPALVHPASGVILAAGIGTQYALCLTGALAAEAILAGAKTVTVWADGSRLDVQETLGTDWVFGAWLDSEIVWCRTVYTVSHTAQS